MRVLITGAGGFIGQALMRHFGLLGWRVHGIGRHIQTMYPSPSISQQTMELPSPALADTLEHYKPNLLVHAANTAVVGRSLTDPLEDYHQSLGTWISVIEAVRCSQSQTPCRIILLSSAAVYGEPETLPIDEKQLTYPSSPYGYHKRMCEEVAEYYVRFYGLKVCIGRIFSAYGQGLRRQVLWDICQKALRGGTVELMGTGEEARDFIHIQDMVVAITCLAMRGDYQSGVYNIASGTATRITYLAQEITMALGTDNKIIFNNQKRAGDPSFWQADVGKLSALGFNCQVTIEQGVAEYCQWIQELHAGSI